MKQCMLDSVLKLLFVQVYSVVLISYLFNVQFLFVYCVICCEGITGFPNLIYCVRVQEIESSKWETDLHDYFNK